MARIRLPLAVLALALSAACRSTPTTPAAPREPDAAVVLQGDTITGARGGNLIGSGN